MTGPPVWINNRALLLLHAESLSLFGGAAGLRDEGLLDSALARPVNLLVDGDGIDLAALAAAYGYGLARIHAFVDGNKRAAFLAIGLFLALNGLRLRADRVEAIHKMVALAAGTLSEAQLASWIRTNQAPK